MSANLYTDADRQTASIILITYRLSMHSKHVPRPTQLRDLNAIQTVMITGPSVTQNSHCLLQQ